MPHCSEEMFAKLAPLQTKLDEQRPGPRPMCSFEMRGCCWQERCERQRAPLRSDLPAAATRLLSRGVFSKHPAREWHVHFSRQQLLSEVETSM